MATERNHQTGFVSRELRKLCPLFSQQVVAVLFLGLDGRLERGVGEYGVVAPDGQQLVLALPGLAVEVFDPADQSGGR